MTRQEIKDTVISQLPSDWKGYSSGELGKELIDLLVETLFTVDDISSSIKELDIDNASLPDLYRFAAAENIPVYPGITSWIRVLWSSETGVNPYEASIKLGQYSFYNTYASSSNDLKLLCGSVKSIGTKNFTGMSIPDMTPNFKSYTVNDEKYEYFDLGTGVVADSIVIYKGDLIPRRIPIRTSVAQLFDEYALVSVNTDGHVILKPYFSLDNYQVIWLVNRDNITVTVPSSTQLSIGSDKVSCSVLDYNQVDRLTGIRNQIKIGELLGGFLNNPTLISEYVNLLQEVNSIKAVVDETDVTLYIKSLVKDSNSNYSTPVAGGIKSYFEYLKSRIYSNSTLDSVSCVTAYPVSFKVVIEKIIKPEYLPQVWTILNSFLSYDNIKLNTTVSSGELSAEIQSYLGITVLLKFVFKEYVTEINDGFLMGVPLPKTLKLYDYKDNLISTDNGDGTFPVIDTSTINKSGCTIDLAPNSIRLWQAGNILLPLGTVIPVYRLGDSGASAYDTSTLIGSACEYGSQQENELSKTGGYQSGLSDETLLAYNKSHTGCYWWYAIWDILKDSSDKKTPLQLSMSYHPNEGLDYFKRMKVYCNDLFVVAVSSSSCSLNAPWVKGTTVAQSDYIIRFYLKKEFRPGASPIFYVKGSSLNNTALLRAFLAAQGVHRLKEDTDNIGAAELYQNALNLSSTTSEVSGFECTSGVINNAKGTRRTFISNYPSQCLFTGAHMISIFTDSTAIMNDTNLTTIPWDKSNIYPKTGNIVMSVVMFGYSIIAKQGSDVYHMYDSLRNEISSNTRNVQATDLIYRNYKLVGSVYGGMTFRVWNTERWQPQDVQLGYVDRSAQTAAIGGGTTSNRNTSSRSSSNVRNTMSAPTRERTSASTDPNAKVTQSPPYAAVIIMLDGYLYATQPGSGSLSRLQVKGWLDNLHVTYKPAGTHFEIPVWQIVSSTEDNTLYLVKTYYTSTSDKIEVYSLDIDVKELHGRGSLSAYTSNFNMSELKKVEGFDETIGAMLMKPSASAYSGLTWNNSVVLKVVESEPSSFIFTLTTQANNGEQTTKLAALQNYFRYVIDKSNTAVQQKKGIAYSCIHTVSGSDVSTLSQDYIETYSLKNDGKINYQTGEIEVPNSGADYIVYDSVQTLEHDSRYIYKTDF